jgi:phosphoribosylaminoimidazole-succinocarboxamide synthase
MSEPGAADEAAARFARWRELIAGQLGNVLTDAAFPELPGHVRGKVRDNYDLPDGRRILVATDRQSAFDRILAAVPFKGQVLTGTARFWFEATADIVGNHVVEHPDPNVLVARRLQMLPVEIVVRDYLTGSTATSIWPMYAAGQRKMYGLTLPDGLRKNEKLAETILTPTTKAAEGEHDEPVTPAEIVGRGLLSRERWEEAADCALRLFARGRDIARRNGLILVDTKYEFGLDAGGRLTLADEIHTPDSSRYWRIDSYEARLRAGAEPESLDKEFLRHWIIGRCDPYKEPIPEIPAATLIEFSARYIALYETVTGAPFHPPDTAVPIRDRVRRALQRYMPEKAAEVA